MNRYKKEESKREKPFPGREMTQEEWMESLDKEGSGADMEDWDDHYEKEAAKKDAERPKAP